MDKKISIFDRIKLSLGGGLFFIIPLLLVDIFFPGMNLLNQYQWYVFGTGVVLTTIYFWRE